MIFPHPSQSLRVWIIQFVSIKATFVIADICLGLFTQHALLYTLWFDTFRAGLKRSVSTLASQVYCISHLKKCFPKIHMMVQICCNIYCIIYFFAVRTGCNFNSISTYTVDCTVHVLRHVKMYWEIHDTNLLLSASMMRMKWGWMFKQGDDSKPYNQENC